MLQTRLSRVGLARCCIGLLGLASCGHSEPFVAPPITPQAPSLSGNDVRLTFNPGADYSPSWTEDGRGILYRFAQPQHSDDDRCIGLLPAAGGTQVWSLCDNRLGQADSSSSFLGVALGSDGRLLYQELTARANKPIPDHNVLWLADSAAPFNRRALITFPILLSGTEISFLSDVIWTGQDQFIALAGTLSFLNHPFSIALDTVLTGQMVVRGIITSAGATLTPIDGTAGATEFSLAAGGAAIVFFRSALHVEQVPASGGTPVMVSTFPDTAGRRLVGLTCKATACVVLTYEPNEPLEIPPQRTLWSLALADGTQLELRAIRTPLQTPRLAPGSSDLAIQSGLGSAGDLYLYKGLLP